MQVAITLERPNKSYVSTGVYLLLEAAKGESDAVVTQFLITCIGPGDAGATRVQVKLVMSIPEMCTYILYIHICIGIVISHAVLAT